MSQIGPVYAQSMPHLPISGQMVGLSKSFNPIVLSGIRVHPTKPFEFDFLIDTGDSNDSRPVGAKNVSPLEQESHKLIKYFLAALTTPEQDFWVNLSPYEANRIIPDQFGKTTMGRDLLAQDYLLKQITSSLVHPDNEAGKQFWDSIYKQAFAKLGHTNIPMDTFNKVWIVPNKAVVYEGDGVAYVKQANLKVMLEKDYYLSKTRDVRSKTNDDTNRISTDIMQSVIIPVLEQEVNEGEHFASLRQIYNSLILATWYKQKLKDSLLAQVYADQKKVNGLGYVSGHRPLVTGHSAEPTLTPDDIYDRYLDAFREGVFNFIKEEYDPATQETIPRKYFSGGASIGVAAILEKDSTMPTSNRDFAMLNVAFDAQSTPDPAMPTTNAEHDVIMEPVLESWNHIFDSGFSYLTDDVFDEQSLFSALTIHQVVNPNNLPLRMLYAGAGANVSGALTMFGARDNLFVSQYKGLTADYLREVRKILKIVEERGPAVLSTVWPDERMDGYLTAKSESGGAHIEDTDNEFYLMMGLVLEFHAMRIYDIKVDDEQGVPRVRFEWDRFETLPAQEHTITFVDADITNVDEYPPFLIEQIEQGFHAYLQKRGFKIAESYTQQGPRNFIRYIYAGMPADAYFVTDDHYVSHIGKGPNGGLFGVADGDASSDFPLEDHQYTRIRLPQDKDFQSATTQEKYGRFLRVRRVIKSGDPAMQTIRQPARTPTTQQSDILFKRFQQAKEKEGIIITGNYEGAELREAVIVPHHNETQAYIRDNPNPTETEQITVWKLDGEESYTLGYGTKEEYRGTGFFNLRQRPDVFNIRFQVFPSHRKPAHRIQNTTGFKMFSFVERVLAEFHDAKQLVFTLTHKDDEKDNPEIVRLRRSLQMLGFRVDDDPNQMIYDIKDGDHAMAAKKAPSQRQLLEQLGTLHHGPARAMSEEHAHKLSQDLDEHLNLRIIEKHDQGNGIFSEMGFGGGGIVVYYRVAHLFIMDVEYYLKLSPALQKRLGTNVLLINNMNVSNIAREDGSIYTKDIVRAMIHHRAGQYDAMDLGAGDGVLGLVAHKLGSVFVDFFETKPIGIRQTRAHMRLNGLVNRTHYAIHQVDVTDRARMAKIIVSINQRIKRSGRQVAALINMGYWGYNEWWANTQDTMLAIEDADNIELFIIGGHYYGFFGVRWHVRLDQLLLEQKGYDITPEMFHPTWVAQRKKNKGEELSGENDWLVRSDDLEWKRREKRRLALNELRLDQDGDIASFLQTMDPREGKSLLHFNLGIYGLALAPVMMGAHVDVVVPSSPINGIRKKLVEELIPERRRSYRSFSLAQRHFNDKNRYRQRGGYDGVVLLNMPNEKNSPDPESIMRNALVNVKPGGLLLVKDKLHESEKDSLQETMNRILEIKEKKETYAYAMEALQAMGVEEHLYQATRLKDGVTKIQLSAEAVQIIQESDYAMSSRDEPEELVIIWLQALNFPNSDQLRAEFERAIKNPEESTQYRREALQFVGELLAKGSDSETDFTLILYYFIDSDNIELSKQAYELYQKYITKIIQKNSHEMRYLIKSALHKISIKSLIDEKNISINLELPDDSMWFQDRDVQRRGSMGSQVVEELIYNAVKYAHTNGEIRIVANIDGKNISMIVENEGIGMSEEEISRIFEYSYRTQDAQRTHDGTGKGLAFLKSILEDLYHGSISVEAKKGEWAKFTVTFPIVDKAITTQEKSHTGGVDLTSDWLNIDVEHDQAMQNFNFDEAMIADMRANTTGFKINILSVSAIKLHTFLAPK